MFVRSVSVVLVLIGLVMMVGCGEGENGGEEVAGETSWVVTESMNDLTDERTVVIATEAKDHNRRSGAFVALAIVCRENLPSTPEDLRTVPKDVSIFWDTHISDFLLLGDWERWDDAPLMKSSFRWKVYPSSSKSTRLLDFRSVPLPDGRSRVIEGVLEEFIGQVKTSKTLLLRLEGDDEDYEATFNLVGLNQHLEDYADLCEAKE